MWEVRYNNEKINDNKMITKWKDNDNKMVEAMINRSNGCFVLIFALFFKKRPGKFLSS